MLRVRVRVLASVFALIVVGASASVGCSSDRDGFEVKATPIVPPDGGEPIEAAACGYRCSRDLKQVLEVCEGEEKVAKVCPPGQGCGIDDCVDACSSAALSKGSIGCSFWTVPPDDARYGAGSCFAAMIANTWDVPVTIKAGYGADPLDISKATYTAAVPDGSAGPVYTRLDGPLAPGDVAIVFLAQADVPVSPDAVACPVGTTPALMVDPIRRGTTKTKAFHFETDAPVAAYSIFPYGGAPSKIPTATLLLPVSSWDERYIAVSTAKFRSKGEFLYDQRTLQIVANEDDTKVAMRPTVEVLQGDGVEPGAAGEPVEWTLSKGQVLQLTQFQSTSGSPIEANKPVAVFGGSPCTYLPLDKQYCDLTQQQIAPFAQWGTSYALVPYRPRIDALAGPARETVLWSFVGAVDGTVLTYEPARPPGAPATLSAGEVAAFETDAIVTVKSQDSKHPFQASVYMSSSMSGGGSPSGGRTLGDPDFVTIVPSDQFLDRYVFFADYTFPETSLTLVRRKTSTGFKPVTLACAGEITGWEPLGTSGEFEFTWVHLTAGSRAQTFAGGACGYGRHEAASEGPFSVTVWGIGRDASYGYAGGMGSRPINDAPPPLVK
ncbi:hypothetical protein AKJ09_04011 [Labilithrix luteola]|uniref:IgGFc-binding protein N-terminal domain-containing protein n=1 Tax=Labilithrix luteola TaxID=1391654 RepID=A0A0K1PUZ8_9BACT|nr:IgGFc-binding protein [Labilithrix luteola]AKU97347.1 hypothetical protein AKJ09_04011 [Labilithrix luteola]